MPCGAGKELFPVPHVLRGWGHSPSSSVSRVGYSPGYSPAQDLEDPGYKSLTFSLRNDTALEVGKDFWSGLGGGFAFLWSREHTLHLGSLEGILTTCAAMEEPVAGAGEMCGVVSGLAVAGGKG